MNIICKNTKNIIIAGIFASICLLSVAPAQAGCYDVCDASAYRLCPPQDRIAFCSSPMYWNYFCVSKSIESAPWYNPNDCWNSLPGPNCVIANDNPFIFGPYLSGGRGGVYCTSSHWRCDGECNPAHFNCNFGVPANQTNLPNNFTQPNTGWRWDCNGTGGGSNTYCTETNCEATTCKGVPCWNPSGWTTGKKDCPIPINGVCNNSTQYSCITSSPATSRGENTTSTQWTWTCPGLNGGKDATDCYLLKPVTGVCNNDDHRDGKRCSSGTEGPVTDTGSGWTWTCYGAGTGVDSPLCSKTKCNTSNICESSNITGTATSCCTYGDDPKYCFGGTKPVDWRRRPSSSSCSFNPSVSCTLAECGQDISAGTYSCYWEDLNSCFRNKPCSAAEIAACGNPGTKPCPDCPITPGTWREVSP